jgi:hypothetical protein
MKARFRPVVATFGWWQWTLAAVFVLAVVLAGLFTVRTVTYTLYWRSHQNEPIERWMTVGYIAHSYGLPREVLEEALGLPPSRPPLRADRRPLSEIATAQGKTFDQLKTTLQDAIAKARPPVPPGAPKASPPPPPPKSERLDRGAP